MPHSPTHSTFPVQRLRACFRALKGFSFASVMGLALALGMAAVATMSGIAQAQTRRAATAPKPVCLVADFRSLALETHDPQQRANASRDWLRANGGACTAAQLGNIASNRAAWLGNADSPTLMGMIDRMIETREAAGGSAPLAANQTAPNQTITTGTPPPRIVPPANAAGAIPSVAPVVVPVAVPVAEPKS